MFAAMQLNPVARVVFAAATTIAVLFWIWEDALQAVNPSPAGSNVDGARTVVDWGARNRAVVLKRDADGGAENKLEEGTEVENRDGREGAGRGDSGCGEHPVGWSGPGEGSNWCNTCTCWKVWMPTNNF